jgi:nucleoid-associated protein YgaU
VLSGFDDPKVQSVFKKFPSRPGGVKLKYNSTPLSDEQLDKSLELIEDNLREKMKQALKDVSMPNTVERINELLLLVRQSDVLPIVTVQQYELFQLGSQLVEKARAMTIVIAEDSAKVFRNHPSSENYFKWLAANKMIDVIGADLPDNFAPPFIFLYNKPYTVTSGDTLSKIALKYYGHENLWDIIWEASGMNFHPDLIIPGQKLILP